MGAVPIEVRIRSRFLVTTDVLGFPTEKEIKRLVDDVGEKGRVDDMIPQWDGREDSFATKNEVHERGPITTMSQIVLEWGT